MAKNKKIDDNEGNVIDFFKKQPLTHMDKTPPKKTGDGNGGDSLETRVTRLEVKVDHIQSDITEIKTDIKENFKWIMGLLITSILIPILLHFIS